MLSTNHLINCTMEESNNTQLSGNTQLTISENGKTYLNEIGKWSKFLGILMYITMGFMILSGIILIAASIAGGAGTSMAGDIIGLAPALLGVIYIIIGIIYLFPAKYLTKGGSNLKKGIAGNSNEAIEEGIKNTKSYYKFCGILAIISLALVVIAMITIIIVSIAAAMNIG